MSFTVSKALCSVTRATSSTRRTHARCCAGPTTFSGGRVGRFARPGRRAVGPAARLSSVESDGHSSRDFRARYRFMADPRPVGFEGFAYRDVPQRFAVVFVTSRFGRTKTATDIWNIPKEKYERVSSLATAVGLFTGVRRV